MRQFFSRFFMVPHRVRSLVRRSVLAAIALLASVVMVPSHAQASCGDYVMIGSHAAGNHGEQQQKRGQTPAVPPCQGPRCSNNSIPPLAPAPKIEMPVERWAISRSEWVSLLPNREVLLADAHDLPCDGFGLSILRPPR